MRKAAVENISKCGFVRICQLLLPSPVDICSAVVGATLSPQTVKSKSESCPRKPLWAEISERTRQFAQNLACNNFCTDSG